MLLVQIPNLTVLLFVITVDEVASRNGIPFVTRGDHSYACPEQSTDFHKKGSTRPPANFGRQVI